MNDDREVMDRQPLVEALENAGCKVKGASCTCPWHEDSTPSAQIKAPNGHWRVTCFVCNKFGDVHDIRAHNSGRPLTDVLKAKSASPMVIKPKPAPEKPLLVLADKKAVVEYCQRHGSPRSWYVYGQKSAPTLIVGRIEQNNGKKTFRQFTPCASGYTVGNTNEVGSLPLYRQDEIADAATILVVEGEKACDAAWTMGIPAVTSAMGSKNAEWSDWSALSGKKVIIWPDNDQPGADYADTVTSILSDLGCTVGRLDPNDMAMPEGGDIADLLEKWGDPTADELDAVRTFIEGAEMGGAAAALAAWQAEVMAGKWQTLDMPHPVLGKLTRAMMPGAITMFCADPGAGKSWWTLQCMRFWNESGHKTVVRMMEDDIRLHTSRVLAQITGNNHSDDRWVKGHPEAVREDMMAHAASIDRLGSLITAETDELITHTELSAWAEKKAKSGARVIMIDPITGIKQGKEPWVQDFELVMRFKSIAKKYGCSIVICTHPRGNSKEPSLTGMSGGVAWARFAHTVIWLSQIPTSMVEMHSGSQDQADRIFHILKCRYGKGNKQNIAAMFAGDCTIQEVGLMAPKKKAGQNTEQPQEKPVSDRGAKLRSKPNNSEDQFP